MVKNVISILFFVLIIAVFLNTVFLIHNLYLGYGVNLHVAEEKIKDFKITKVTVNKRFTISEADIILPTTEKAPMLPEFYDERESFTNVIENSLAETLKYDKDTGCDMPIASEFSPGFHNGSIIQCNKGNKTTWIICETKTCTVNPVIWKTYKNLNCKYESIIHIDDYKYNLGPGVILKNNHTYNFNDSDHVKITCKAEIRNVTGKGKSWRSYGTGFRPIEPKPAPEGRENSYNILLFVFDSTSRGRFFAEMPKSLKFLQQELDATVFQKYHIIGDGTASSLLPILTGKNEHELPECRKDVSNSSNSDSMPLLFYKLRDDGYRTAFFEDMPWIGLFTKIFNGFQHQPTDHYLRSLFMASFQSKRWSFNSNNKFCVGLIPRFQFVMNLTDQFFDVSGKKFSFTFVSDITNDILERLNNADEAFVSFLRRLLKKKVFNNTLLVILGTGDHGVITNYGKGSRQGKYLERLPFMAMRLPDQMIQNNPNAQWNLRTNADVLITPHDVYATILDVVGLKQYWNQHRVKGANLTRGMTILKPIPKTRSCSEAGIGAHWCACTKWQKISEDHPMYYRAATALLDAINFMTDFLRSKCTIRTLKTIHWVTSWITDKKYNQHNNKDVFTINDNKKHLYQHKNKDVFAINNNKNHLYQHNYKDFFAINDKKIHLNQHNYKDFFALKRKIIDLNDIKQDSEHIKEKYYQVKITVGPGNSVFEATVKHLLDINEVIINPREITRINGFNYESHCISKMFPQLSAYCYCME